MKKLLSVAALGLVLTACNTPNHIEGTLSVSTKVNVFTTWDNKRVVLAPGTYNTSLALQSDGGEVHIHTQSGSVNFKVPQVKADNLGNISIPAASLGQEFGLQGKIYQAQENFDRTVSQSCVHHYDQDYQCRNEQHCVKDGAGNETCGTENVCEWVQVPVNGTEPVHETGYQESKNVAINMVKAGKAIGRFAGRYDYQEHISSSEVVGGCRL